MSEVGNDLIAVPRHSRLHYRIHGFITYFIIDPCFSSTPTISSTFISEFIIPAPYTPQYALPLRISNTCPFSLFPSYVNRTENIRLQEKKQISHDP